MFVNYIKIFIRRLLPTFLQQPKMRAWIFSLLNPLADIVALFYAAKVDLSERVHFNGQTIVLEHALNYQFPDGAGDYYIDNNNSSEFVAYIFQHTEVEKTYMFLASESPGDVLYLYEESEHLPEISFTVYMPQSSVDAGDTEDEVRAFVELYKIAGKQFNIIIYTP